MLGSGGIRGGGGQHFLHDAPPNSSPSSTSYFTAHQQYQQQLFMNFSQHPQVAPLPPAEKNAIFQDFYAFINDRRVSQWLGSLDLHSQIQYHMQFSSFIQQNPLLQQYGVDKVAYYIGWLNSQQQSAPATPQHMNIPGSGAAEQSDQQRKRLREESGVVEQPRSNINISVVQYLSPQEINSMSDLMEKALSNLPSTVSRIRGNDDAIRRKLPPNDVLKITTSHLHNKTCTPRDAAKMLKNLIGAGIKPDTITCSTAITVCANALKHAKTKQDADAIFAFFQRLLTMMSQASIPLNTITCSTAITVCANALKHATTKQDVDAIFVFFQSLLTRMSQDQIPLNTITCNTAITVCANALKHATTKQDADAIFVFFQSLLTMMSQDKIKLNTITCSTAITVCANALKTKWIPKDDILTLYNSHLLITISIQGNPTLNKRAERLLAILNGELKSGDDEELAQLLQEIYNTILDSQVT